MYRSTTLFIFLFSCLMACQVQSQEAAGKCTNQDFEKKINNLLSFSVPTVVPSELAAMDAPMILDAREKEEYQVSHIPGAKCIGYDDFDMSSLEGVDKDELIVVYCSIGYRSEKIGEKLQKNGFTNVHNLYGSIFEWVNQSHEVVDDSEKPTNKVHTYNKNWSKWLDESKGKRVW